MTEIDSNSLRAAMRADAEIALLDIREQGEFGQCHLFWAVNAPLSRIELEVSRLVPRPGTRIVVTAAGDAALVRRGAETLASIGYTDVSVCPAAPDDWQSAGFTVYSGINVPSKAFGEAVEHHYETPSIPAQTLKQMQDRGDDLVVLDSRTFAEYRNMNIPGGVSVPGGELAYRIRDFVSSDDTTIVVNCAGRTRSIVGAQSVINSGVPNRVVALENGTMGWHLAGLELEHGRTDRFDAGDPRSLAAALEMRDRIVAEYGISTITYAALDDWRRENAERTLYLLDVRDPDEFAAGHLPGARSAPGGQLVQATDFQIGVPGGRIVLVDDTGVRATMTAHWLVQMGFPDVHVLVDGMSGAQETAPEPTPEVMPAPEVSVEDLSRRLGEADLAILDLGESRVFRKAHIPGAKWAIRSRIGQTGPALPEAGTVILTSADGRVAALGVEEVRALTGAEVFVLAGGTDAWAAAGHKVEGDPAYPADEDCIDVYLRAYDRNADVEARMQEYIDWEIALINQIADDPDVEFRLGPVA